MAAPNIMAKVIEKYYSKTLFKIFAGPLQSIFLSDRSVSKGSELS
jgi:hypothetical protein